MSGITARTIFYDASGGVVRWWDWAEVKTSLGTMAEPHLINQRHTANAQFIQYETDDMIAKVTGIEQRSLDQVSHMFSGELTVGGTQLPKNGR